MTWMMEMVERIWFLCEQHRLWVDMSRSEGLSWDPFGYWYLLATMSELELYAGVLLRPAV